MSDEEPSNIAEEDIETQEVEPGETRGGETVTILVNEKDQDSTGTRNAEMEEDESRSELTFQHRVTKISELRGPHCSPVYYVRNIPWKIMVMRRKTPTKENGDYSSLGFYLQCNRKAKFITWSCYATADLRILPQKEGTEIFSREIQHLFCPREDDWGYNRFIPLIDLLNPEKGYIKNDTIVLEVYIQADVARGVSVDSKKRTGYVGLEKRWAICYKNSLQTSKESNDGNMESNSRAHLKRDFARHNEREELNEPQSRRAELNGIQLFAKSLEISCLRLISEHGRPFSLMDDDAFQCIVNPIINALPANERFNVSSASMRDRVPYFADDVRKVIAQEIRERPVCLKVDATTENCRAFLGVHAQYVMDGKVVVRTLAVKEMLSSHTPANINVEILSVLKQFDIPVEHIVTITSDSGAKMLKAAELLRVDQETVAEEEIVSDSPEEEFWPDFELHASDFKLSSVRCAAHHLQLAVEDAIRNTLGVKPLLDIVRKIATKLRTPALSGKLRTKSLSIPVLDVNTHWEPTYDMAKSVLLLRDFIVQQEDEVAVPSLIASQWNLLEEVVKSLEPAKKATVKLQEQQLLLGDFLATWVTCKLCTQQIESSLAKELHKNMEQRERPHINMSGEEKLPALFKYPGFVAAIFLDPRYMSVLTEDEVYEAKTYLTKLWQRMERMRSEESDEGRNENAAPIEELVDEEDDDNSNPLTVFLKQKNEERSSNISSSKENVFPLLEAYGKNEKALNYKTDVLLHWEKQRLLSPQLYDLAITVLSIPASQVSVERLFSALPFILDPLRFNLDSSILNDFLILNTNKELVRILADTRLVRSSTPNSIGSPRVLD